MNFEKRYQRLKLSASLNHPFAVTYNRTKGSVNTGDTPSRLMKLVKKGEAEMMTSFTDWNGDKIEVYTTKKI